MNTIDTGIRFAQITHFTDTNEYVYTTYEKLIDDHIDLVDIVYTNRNTRTLSSTRLKDVNGRYIMEGDVIELNNWKNCGEDIIRRGIVVYSEGFTSFGIVYIRDDEDFKVASENLLSFLDYTGDDSLDYQMDAVVLGTILDFKNKLITSKNNLNNN